MSTAGSARGDWPGGRRQAEVPVGDASKRPRRPVARFCLTCRAPYAAIEDGPYWRLDLCR